MTGEALRAWLARGPFTLALSSSYFGFYAHAGLMQAFEEAGVRPAKLTGASAGALIGAAWASGMSSHEVRELLFQVKRADFWDPGLGAGLLRGGKFRRLIAGHFVSRFEDTRIPFEVAVFDILRARTEYVGRGDLPSAVVASCAVPGLFHPVRREGRWLWDGGVFDKPGVNVTAARAGGERVLSVILEAGSRVASWYERGVSGGGGGIGGASRERRGPGIGNDWRELRIGGLPGVGFDRLEIGPRAFEECHARVRRELDRSLESGDPDQ